MSSIDYEGGLQLHLRSQKNLLRQTLENANRKVSGDEWNHGTNNRTCIGVTSRPLYVGFYVLVIPVYWGNNCHNKYNRKLEKHI
jgi:hypothetical protein